MLLFLIFQSNNTKIKDAGILVIVKNKIIFIPMEIEKIKTDIVLVGTGIMSATLGILLKELQPDLTISIFERLPEIAKESTDAWNNAGTGHSAFCELNYTPEQADGSIDISKAKKIAASFELTKEFWAYLVAQKKVIDPKDFIHQTPHLSFVWGEENVTYLKKRFEALSLHPLFAEMQYSADKTVLEKWMPLVMLGRAVNEKVAATKMDIGTDIDFGNITRAMFAYLEKQNGVSLYLEHEVRDIDKNEAGRWDIKIKNIKADEKFIVESKFVFIGAGGGTLPLLEKSDIEEAVGYGGFPISGQWLVCKNESVIAQHQSKVYGKASVGAPPMSVPHLDTRIIDGKKALLFGPFAGFSTKFLKQGSYWDLVTSLEFDNIFPMLSAGAHNWPLTKYLIQQVRLSHEDRIEELRHYLPNVRSEDWELSIAGQRVQVIKKDKEVGGILEFGTELVCSKDGSIAALLGASPGASTAVTAMIDVLKKCFVNELSTEKWQDKLRKMMPSYGQSFSDNGVLVLESRRRTGEILGI
jgi:malate dehydrogenase (quinone)